MRNVCLSLLLCSVVLLGGNRLPDQEVTMEKQSTFERLPHHQRMLFTGGCFWGLQETFDSIDGVLHTQAGYTGGDVPAPAYEMVIAGKTGHAEAVEVIYDPEQISAESLIEVFYGCHKPTLGPVNEAYYRKHYRSGIFVESESQRKAAVETRDRLLAEGKWKALPATQIESTGPFWPAEDYHQNYYARKTKAYCPLP